MNVTDKQIKNMRQIKFRQRTQSDRWHYWGFVDGAFSGPSLTNEPLKEALEHSQQFTGLKDRNGKDIYEGDILMKMGQFTTPKRNLYEVMFDDGAFVGHSVKEYEVIGKGKRHIELFPLTDSWDNNPAEVIGNIYDSPELIK